MLTILAGDDRRPDVVISDFRLGGGKTGIEAIQRLRGTFGAAIPAFLITGDIAPEHLREASANSLHLLHKPVAPMALRAMLNQLLKADGRTAERLQTTAASGSFTIRHSAADPSPAHPLQ